MSIQKTITLTDKGVNAGPTYTLSYSSDCVTYTSFGIVTLSEVGDTTIVNVPDNTICIKLTSIGECTNEVVQSFGPASTTTTTTTTAAPTTTTTISPTTTTTIPPSGIATNGLVLWNTCNSNSGSIWYDVSGNGNHGFVSGSALSLSGSAGYWFNGTNNYVTYPSNLVATPSSSYTLQMLVTPFFGADNTFLFGKYDYSDGWDTLFQPNSVNCNFPLIDNSQTIIRDQPGGDFGVCNTLVTGSSYLFTVSITTNPQQAKWYLNDTLKFTFNPITTEFNSFTASADYLRFGYDSGIDANYFKGGVKQLLVYNRQLSNAEVSANYTALITGSCPTTTTTTTTTAAPTYNYYNVTRFTCPSCTSPTGGIVARNNTTYGTLTTSHYYNNGDGYVYRIDGYNAGPSYTIDLDLAASAGTDCSLTCAI